MANDEDFRYKFGTPMPGLDPKVTTALQDNFRRAATQKYVATQSGLLIPKSAFTAANTVLMGTGAGTYAERTQAQRFKVGSFIVNNATGNQAITGVGFKPGLVRFLAVKSADSDAPAEGTGVMDAAGNQWAHTFNSVGTGVTVYHDRLRTNRCIYFVTNAGVVSVEASFVSMDADGFTFNILREDVAAGATTVLYEAIA